MCAGWSRSGWAALLATAIACAGGEHVGEVALIVAISSGGAAVSIAGVRRWPMLFLVAAGSALSVGLTWLWGDWSAASLGLTYAGIACASAFALFWWRDWKLTERSLTAAGVPLAWLALALATGVAAVAHRHGLLPASESIQTTGDWTALTVIVALAGAMGVAEGLRLRNTRLAVASTPLLMLALEMSIAMLEPASVQAYTTPLGCYVIALSMLFRWSEEFIGPHLYTRELVTLLGVALVVGPGAREALESTEVRWSLLLIAEALVLLAVGFAFGHRWLVVSGVLTVVGVAARFFTTGDGRLPYWVILGLVGMALLGIGVLLLGAREWWDRQRSRIGHWWLAAPLAPDQARANPDDGNGLMPV